MSQDVISITDANFEVEVAQSLVPVLLDFWAPWCGPCRAIAPLVTQLATEFAGKVKVGKVNTDENRELAERFEIRSIPTLLLFCSGGQPAQRMLGSRSKESIKSWVEEILQK